MDFLLSIEQPKRNKESSKNIEPQGLHIIAYCNGMCR